VAKKKMRRPGKSITGKQRAARRRNIKIAREAKRKGTGKTKERFENMGSFVLDHKKKKVLALKGPMLGKGWY